MATAALNAYSSAAAIPVVGYIIAPIAAAMAVAASTKTGAPIFLLITSRSTTTEYSPLLSTPPITDMAQSLSQVPMASPPRPVLRTTKRFGIASIDSKRKDINYEINSHNHPAQDAKGR